MSTDKAREVARRLPIVPREATRWRFSAVTWENAATEPRGVAWEIPGQPLEVHLVVAGEAHRLTGARGESLEEVCAAAARRFPDLRWSDVWWPVNGYPVRGVKLTALLAGACHRSVDFTTYVVAARSDGSWWVHTIKGGRLERAVRIWPVVEGATVAADRQLHHTGRWYTVGDADAARFRGAGLDLVDPTPEVAAPAPEAPAPKVQWSLLPMGALRACAELATWGVVKHPNATWLTLSSTDHWNAAMRHMTAWPTQPTDPESGRSHLVHAAVRLLYAIAREV